MTTFQPGDRVRYQEANGSPNDLNGHLGTVTSNTRAGFEAFNNDDDYVWVKFDEPAYGQTHFKCYPSTLEMVQQVPREFESVEDIEEFLETLE